MTSRRSRLFNYLRFCFFANFALFVVLVSWFVYFRVERSRLLEVVRKQFQHNIKLSSDLAFANDILTNRYFTAAASFASNVLSSVSSPVVSSLPGVSSSSAPSLEDLPPLAFSHYFEVDNIPYIKIRNSSYRRGDIVLGYPIEDISPDVVKYRGKFFKVDQNEK